ncbi:MAG: helix-turn-helix domain-containing protein [Clostridia bacterium]|nr:helix-turn-helix domain-containing protein [Clostridia bacterium]
MKILNFGSCNIDYVYSLDHIVVPGETLSSNSLELFPGGKGLNQSIAAARAGASVFHAGCIGADGEMLRTVLNDSGVDTSFLYSIDCKNGHAIIQVSTRGENSIFLYPGSNALISREIIDKVFESFCSEDIVLLQNETSNVPYIIDKAYEKGMKIAFNPAPFSEALKSIDFNKLTYLILNETEAMGFTGCVEVEESIAYINSRYKNLTVILTLGKDGCVYIKNSLVKRQPAYNVKVKDTTAAGDAFIGYFLAGVCKNQKCEKILKTASAASAITVSKMGAAPSIPCIEEVEESLPLMNEYPLSDNGIAAKIKKYITDNFSTAKLSELAGLLGYTKEYTSELIKKQIGTTFSELVRKMRIETAAYMLKETELSISEIIETIGYSNESFFRKHFKEAYGISPLKYRKEHRYE